MATVGLLTLFTLTPSTLFQSEAVTKVSAAAKVPTEQIKLTTVDGQQFTLAGLRGKVVVLDFFAMQCAHSRDHIRETMTQFSSEQINQGLQIIGIESESSTADQVRQYIADQKINYPVAQIDEPTFAQFVKSRDLSAPQTLVFGRDGKLVLHTNGHSTENEARIRAAVQKALDKK
ncbi:MAG TPA: TlpA disulfide reductase family protein [Blastocatellia bacterium]|nr:TlpA disulfide reductase family protein [Blastocatellia bacterium]